MPVTKASLKIHVSISASLATDIALLDLLVFYYLAQKKQRVKLYNRSQHNNRHNHPQSLRSFLSYSLYILFLFSLYHLPYFSLFHLSNISLQNLHPLSVCRADHRDNIVLTLA